MIFFGKNFVLKILGPKGLKRIRFQVLLKMNAWNFSDIFARSYNSIRIIQMIFERNLVPGLLDEKRPKMRFLTFKTN